MSRIIVSIGLAAVLALGAASITPSLAQVNPFEDQLSDLSAEDRDKLMRAALALYDDPDKPIGTVDRWENTISGNSGAVKLLGRFEHQGLPCVTLQHRLDIATKQDPQFYVINRCKAKDGDWKIL
ncbi:MAG: hypothetical protein AAF495_19405 [Pseudomonadota bacterium]